MSLIDCLQKINPKAIKAEELQNRFEELVESGIDEQAASRQVVNEYFKELQADLNTLRKGLGMKEEPAGDISYEEAAEEQPKPASKKRQPKISYRERTNNLIDLINKTAATKDKTVKAQMENEIKKEVAAINKSFPKAGYKYDSRGGRLVSANGKKVQKRNAVTNNAAAKNFARGNYSPATNQYIDRILEDETLALGLDFRGVDGRRLSEEQRGQMIQSIRDGKPSEAARELFDFIEQAVNDGVVEIEDATTGNKAKLSIDDYFAAQQEVASEVELGTWQPSAQFADFFDDAITETQTENNAEAGNNGVGGDLVRKSISKELDIQILAKENELIEKQLKDIEKAKNDLQAINNGDKSVIEEYVKKSGYKLVTKKVIEKNPKSELLKKSEGKYYNSTGASIQVKTAKQIAYEGATKKSKSKATGSKAGRNQYADVYNAITKFSEGKIRSEEVRFIIEKAGFKISKAIEQILNSKYEQTINETDDTATTRAATEIGTTDSAAAGAGVTGSVPEGSGTEGDTKQKAKELADKIRSFRVDNDKAYDALLGLPVAVYNGMLTTIANVIEGGGTVLKAIEDAVAYIKANTQLTDDDSIRSEVEGHLKKLGVMEEQTEPQPQTPPPPKPRPETQEEGFERKRGQTSFSRRAFEGTDDEGLQKILASYGFDYEVTGYDIAEKTADKIIDDFGIEQALDMVEKGMIDGAESTIIRARMIDKIGEQIALAKTNEERERLVNLDGRLINNFSRVFTKKGQELAVLKEVYERSDFTYRLSFQLNQYASVNGGVVPEEIKKKFEEWSKQLEEQKARIAELEQQAAEREAQEVIDTIKKRQKKQPPKVATEKAKKIANALRQGKINRPGIFLSSSPASAVWDAAIEAAATTIEATGVLADAITAGIQKIKESDWYKGLDKKQKKEAETAFKNYVASSMATDEEGEAPRPKVVKGKLMIPDALIRGLVEGGIDNINDLVAAIKEMIAEEYPDIEDRVIRDAITRYGRVLKMSQDEISQKVRKMKRVGRILSALEDVANKKRPLRSGLQRDKLDAEERSLQKQLREAMKELPMDEETASRELKTALDAVKTRLRNAIEDLEREIATGERKALVRGDITYDEEAKALQERRDALREIRDEMFGEEVSDDVKLQRMINATQKQIDKLEKQIADKDIAVREKRTLTSPELEAKRQQREALKNELQQLREEAGILEQQRINAAVKRTQRQIAELERRLREGDFERKAVKPALQSDELTKERAKLIAIKEKFATEQYKNELKNRTTAQKWKDNLIELWGLPRTLMATGEFSFILIQGGVPTMYNLVRNPKVVIEGLRKMLRSMASESKFSEYEQLVKAQAFYPVVKGSKLALSEYDSKLTAREELGAAGWANTIWDWLMMPSKFVSPKAYEFLKRINPLKFIERGGVAYMNHMRLMQFLNGKEKLERQGKTFEKNPEEFKNLADVINTFSGRARLPYNTEASAKALSLLFFSPRNWYSTIIQTTPLFFYYMNQWGGKDGKITKPSVAQKLAMQQYMVYMTITISSIMAVAAYLNSDDDEENEVNFDPRSTDFMKVKLGNTRIDPFGGRQQMVVYQMRMLLDVLGYQSYTTTTGKTSRMGEGFTPTKFDLTWRLFQNKMAPTLSQLTQYTQTKLKKDPVTGEEKRFTPYGEEYKPMDKLSESSTPIFWQTIPELYREQPATVATFMSAMAALGVSINTYEQKQKAKGKKPKTTFPAMKSLNSGGLNKMGRIQ